MPANSVQENPHPDNLLPWFVNNTLSLPQHNQVGEHLQHCQRCQNEVTLLQQMRQAVKAAPNQPPGELGLNRLLKKVQAEKKIDQALQETQSGSWSRDFAIAASLLILLQAGLLIDAWFLSKPLIPLAGLQEHGIVLQVSFVPTATEEQIRETVSTVHGSFIDGPGQLGIYRIRLNRLPQDKIDVEETIKRLRQQKEVVHHAAKDY